MIKLSSYCHAFSDSLQSERQSLDRRFGGTTSYVRATITGAASANARRSSFCRTKPLLFGDRSIAHRFLARQWSIDQNFTLSTIHHALCISAVFFHNSTRRTEQTNTMLRYSSWDYGFARKVRYRSLCVHRQRQTICAITRSSCQLYKEKNTNSSFL